MVARADWKQARVIVPPKYESTVFDILANSTSGLDAIYASAPMLAVVGLSEAELTLLHMISPRAGFPSKTPGLTIITEDAEFTVIEDAVERLCDNVACHRFIVCNFCFLNEEKLRRFEAALVDFNPDFEGVVERL